MDPILVKEERHGWPSQPLPKPRRALPDPWSVELLLGVLHVRHHALSPDGTRLAFIWDREGNSDLWVMPARASGWPERLTFDRPAIAPWSDIAPRWSPDGKYLAYVSRDEIWIVPAEGGRARKLTDHGHESTDPIFSPDSQRIYYISKRGTYGNLAATTPAGDWPVALTRFDGDVSDPRPSPDGRRIAFVYHPPSDLNRSEICLVPAVGGEVRHLTGQPGVWDVRPRWAPDGSRLAFVSNRSGYRELYLLDPESGESLQLTAGMADIQAYDWSPDGTRLVHVADHNGAGDLHRVTLATREDRRLRGDSGWHSLPQWSADGKAVFVGFESPLDAPDLWKVDAESGEAERLTWSMPPALGKASLRAPQFIRYPSTRAATIPAFLYRPSAASAERPCPAIVYPHGGPTSEYVLDWDLMAQWLVAKGYAVLAPNYRGSTGYGLDHQHALHDQWGIVDTEDMLAAADYSAGLGLGRRGPAGHPGILLWVVPGAARSGARSRSQASLQVRRVYLRRLRHPDLLGSRGPRRPRRPRTTDGRSLAEPGRLPRRLAGVRCREHPLSAADLPWRRGQARQPTAKRTADGSLEAPWKDL